MMYDYQYVWILAMIVTWMGWRRGYTYILQFACMLGLAAAGVFAMYKVYGWQYIQVTIVNYS